MTPKLLPKVGHCSAGQPGVEEGMRMTPKLPLQVGHCSAGQRGVEEGMGNGDKMNAHSIDRLVRTFVADLL